MLNNSTKFRSQHSQTDISLFNVISRYLLCEKEREIIEKAQYEIVKKFTITILMLYKRARRAAKRAAAFNDLSFYHVYQGKISFNITSVNVYHFIGVKMITLNYQIALCSPSSLSLISMTERKRH